MSKARPQPSLLSLLNFVGKHGPESLEMLTDILARQGLVEAAKQFHISKTVLSRFVNRNFLKVFVLHPDLRETLEAVEQSRRKHYDESRRKEAVVLRLVTPRREIKEEVGE